MPDVVKGVAQQKHGYPYLELTTVRRERSGIKFVWSDRIGAWICQECGTNAGDYEKHGDYHARLSGVLSDFEGVLEMIELKAPDRDSQ